MTLCKNMLISLPRLLLLIFLMTITACHKHDGDNDCIDKTLVYISIAERQSRSSNYSDSETERVDNAMVYIFDGDSQLKQLVILNRQDLENKTPIEISNYNNTSPKVVVWGNMNGSQHISEPLPGLELSSARVTMIEEDGFTLSPDNLYFGYKEITAENVQEIVINSWVGRVYITVRGIDDANSNAGDYYFTIECKYNSYDFYGEPQPGNVLLRVDAELSLYRQEDLLVHQPVNLVAYPVVSGHREPIIIKLYKRTATGDVLIATADTDVDGQSIVTHPGENTNVLLDFTNQSNVQVSIVFTPWEIIHQWVMW